MTPPSVFGCGGGVVLGVADGSVTAGAQLVVDGTDVGGAAIAGAPGVGEPTVPAMLGNVVDGAAGATEP